jgi:hypothetical protein
MNLLLRLLGMGAKDGVEIRRCGIHFINLKTPFQGLLFILAAIAAAYGVWWFYKREPEYCTTRRRKIMAGLRFFGILILLLIISNPVLDVLLNNMIKGKVVVLVDNSQSMSRVDTYSRPEDRLVPAHVIGDVSIKNTDARSISAATEEKLKKTTRWDIMKGVFTNKDLALLDKLQSQYDVEVWNFARGDESGMQNLGAGKPKVDAGIFESIKPEGVVTEIGGALRSTINRVKGQPLSGIILVSDGGNNKGEEPASVAQDSPVRIFPVGIGVPESQDVALTRIIMESKIFVDDPVRIDVRLKQHGFNGEQASLVITSDDTELARQPVVLKESGEQTETVYIKAKKPGRFVYKAEIKLNNPELHDSEPSNNYKTKDIEVIDQKFNVLILEADPRWEFRYLKNSLLRDKRVNVKIFQDIPDIAELSKSGTTYIKEFPTREELFKYHVIVFGNVRNGLFAEKDLDNLVRFVRDEGGGIWFIAGKNNFPDGYQGSKLDQLIPVEFDRNSEVTSDDEWRSPLTDPFRVVLTPEGRANSICRLESNMTEAGEEQNASLWELVPPMYWCHKANRAKLNARTLLVYGGTKGAGGAKRGEAMPLMVQARVGKGKILYQAFSDLWRMRYPIELGPDALERFHGHVVQDLGLAKLLGRTARIEINTDKESYTIGDRTKIDARVLTKKDLEYSTADHVTALITDVNNESFQETVSLTPIPGMKGSFRGEYPAKLEGKFRVTLKDEEDEKNAHADFSVTIPFIEMDTPEMKKELLDNIARSSARGDASGKAHMYFADQAGELLQDMKQSQRSLDEPKQIALWDSPLLLILFTLLMGAEWLMRKRSDLL